MGLADGGKEQFGFEQRTEYRTEVARVSKAAGKGAEEEGQEDLDAANPGHVGRIAADKVNKKGLEDTKRIHEAPTITSAFLPLYSVGRRLNVPGVHDNQMARHDLRPGDGSAVRRRPRIFEAGSPPRYPEAT